MTAIIPEFAKKDHPRQLTGAYLMMMMIMMNESGKSRSTQVQTVIDNHCCVSIHSALICHSALLLHANYTVTAVDTQETRGTCVQHVCDPPSVAIDVKSNEP